MSKLQEIKEKLIEKKLIANITNANAVCLTVEEGFYLIEQLEQAQAANQKLVECLEWYANKNLYFRTEHNMASIDFDEGHKARQTLIEVKGND